MERPKVSILIPAYNQTKLLRKTLDSIVLQSYKDFEVVLCDDSTNNEVEELSKNYANKFALRYHHNAKSLGSPANWNKALELANGDLIKFMHHDDWFSGPDALLNFVSVFEKLPTLAMVFCDSDILNLGTGKLAMNVPSPKFLKSLKKDPRILFDANLIGAPTAMMFKKSSLRFDEKIKFVVDVDFYIQLLSGATFHYINEALIVNTTGHAGQVTEASRVKEVELGEFIYLYNKLYKGKIPSLKQSIFFIRLFRNYHIYKFEDLNFKLSGFPQPIWFFKLLFRISHFYRKTGR